MKGRKTAWTKKFTDEKIHERKNCLDEKLNGRKKAKNEKVWDESIHIGKMWDEKKPDEKMSQTLGTVFKLGEGQECRHQKATYPQVQVSPQILATLFGNTCAKQK